jgi:hypothetical protein
MDELEREMNDISKEQVSCINTSGLFHVSPHDDSLA